jgi:hypothetical protein
MLKLNDSEEVVKGVCGLLYAELIIKFLNIPIRKLHSQKYGFCTFSEEINSKIMNTFTLEAPNGRYVLFVLQVGGNWDVVEIIWHRRNINHLVTIYIQGDPREPDIFKINSTQLFFQVNSRLFIQN